LSEDEKWLVSGSVEQRESGWSLACSLSRGLVTVGGQETNAVLEQKQESGACPGAGRQLTAIITSKAVITATWQHCAFFTACYS